MHLRSIHYCLPLGGARLADAETELRAHAMQSRYFELWMLGFVDPPSAAMVEALARDFPGRLIVPLRPPPADGVAAASPRAEVSLEARLALVDDLVRADLYLDLELRTQRPEVDAFRRHPKPTARFIVSHHDYARTPSLEDLMAIASDARAVGATITKVATLCRSPDDALRLLQFERWLTARGQRHIVLGMGKHGVATRIFGTLWGNEFVYAPVDPSRATAPGQLTRAQLEAIFAQLGSIAGA
ncbi:MAG: type I 3-dehydroquinate dehydratase [Planctomycetota bacterium]